MGVTPALSRISTCYGLATVCPSAVEYRQQSPVVNGIAPSGPRVSFHAAPAEALGIVWSTP